MERFFMPRILIKTDGQHDPSCFSFGFRAALELYHQAAISVQESGDIRQINLRSTSHGIALLFLTKKEDWYSLKNMNLRFIHRFAHWKWKFIFHFQFTADDRVSPLLAELAIRITAESSNFLLRPTPLKYETPVTDRDRPVSRMIHWPMANRQGLIVPIIADGIGLYFHPSVSGEDDRRVVSTGSTYGFFFSSSNLILEIDQSDSSTQ